MGWASGSGLACEVWDVVRDHIAPEKRQECAARILAMFRAEDADDFSYEDQLLVDAGEKRPAEDE